MAVVPTMSRMRPAGHYGTRAEYWDRSRNDVAPDKPRTAFDGIRLEATDLVVVATLPPAAKEGGK